MLRLSPNNISGAPSTWHSARMRSSGSCGRRRVSRGCGSIGIAAEARALLGPVYDRFTEGFGTVDLRLAKNLLEQSA